MYKLLIYGGAALAGLALLGKNKASTLGYVIDKLDVSVKKMRNIKLSGLTVLNLIVDVQLYNPTAENLTLTAGKVVRLVKMEFYDTTGRFLGESYPNIDGIEIPARSGLTLTGIPVKLNLQNADALINAALSSAMSESSLNYKLTFEALGQSFTINA